MNEGEIILKPIDTSRKEFSSSREARAELLSALGMSENAKPEAINAAVKKINELHRIYLDMEADERSEAKRQEILNILNKLKSAPSLEMAQQIIETDYNLSRKRPDSSQTSNHNAIKIEPIGTFSINGEDYELVHNLGSEDQLIITKAGDYFWQKP